MPPTLIIGQDGDQVAAGAYTGIVHDERGRIIECLSQCDPDLGGAADQRGNVRIGSGTGRRNAPWFYQ